MKRILLVEDENVLRSELKRLLERAGYAVSEAGDVETARALGPESFDLVLSDIRLPGATGESLLAHTGATPLVLMTAFGTVRSAVSAIKSGAVDYISKPFEPEELLERVERVLAGQAPQEEATSNVAAREPTHAKATRPQSSHEGFAEPIILGESPEITSVKKQLAKVAPTDATVLVRGESGTGKELVARAIHFHSERASGPFVPVNCASIPDTLIDSELFGHEKGSFTGAARTTPGLVGAADGGTLFLDEVGELPPSAQARLLRVLQEHEVRKVGAHKPTRVDVRVIAATHRDLAAMVETGAFRKDLYYRLHVFEIVLPPLRKRGDDVVLLARALLERAAARMGKDAPVLAEDAIASLRGAAFAGNVRELENALQRALILHEDGPLDASLLQLAPRPTPPPPPPGKGDEDASLLGYFRRYVLQHQEHMSETELAERLGMSRKGLWEKRQRLGLRRRNKSGSEK